MSLFFLFFFFNDPATPEIYTLSLHDALPICCTSGRAGTMSSHMTTLAVATVITPPTWSCARTWCRSEEHTSELQSHHDLVCRLLLEKKKKNKIKIRTTKKLRKIDQISYMTVK